VPPTISHSVFVPASRSLFNVSIIHSSKTAAACHAVDTIDRLWSHERGNLGYDIPALYHNSFLESYVYTRSNPGIRDRPFFFLSIQNARSFRKCKLQETIIRIMFIGKKYQHSDVTFPEFDFDSVKKCRC